MLWFLAVSLVTGPVIASAQDVKLYEASENMRFTNGHLVRRLSTAALVGFANPNTKVCPSSAVQTDPAAAGRCVVNATGSDNLNTATGLGPLTADFTVVVEPDPFPLADPPELVVMRGNIRGQVDLSTAVAFGVPLGKLDATLTSPATGEVVFRGVFRFPFTCGVPPTGYCYDLGDPDVPATWGTFFPVLTQELSLQYPLLRLDITFQP